MLVRRHFRLANHCECAVHAPHGGDGANGSGPGSIAEQTVDHRVNVVLGGGRARFEQTITGGPDIGKTVIQSAQRQGYSVVFDAGSLAAVDSDHVLGLFNAGNMSLEWSGLQAMALPGSGFPNGQSCLENQRPSNEPSLGDMTAKAIDLLDDPQRRRGRNRRGFFLQVEGASIDKQDHAENPCQQIGETIAFDRAMDGAASLQHGGNAHRFASAPWRFIQEMPE